MIVGFDADLRRVPEAEHLLEEVSRVLGLPADAATCTHFLRAGEPRVGMSAEADVDPASVPWGALPAGVAAAVDGRQVGGPVAPGGVARAAAAAAAAAARDGGRAVRFAGSDTLPARLRVAEIISGTAIDIVVQLGAGEAAGEALLDTRGFLRPVWVSGRLVLQVVPAAGGLLVPFEVRDPTPCCAAH